MFDAYRAALREPGAKAFVTVGLFMRLPMAIYPLALVLLVSLRSGDYGFAGVLAASNVVAAAIGNPVLSRWADRSGQRATLVPASLVHAATIVVLVVFAVTDVPRGWWLVPTFLAGVSFVSVGSLVRARWVHLVGGTPRLATALSLESTLDEVVFVTGPIVATVLATTVDPVVPLLVAAALVLGGAVLLARQRATEPPVHTAAPDGARASLPGAPIGGLVLTAAAVGATFGSVEIAATAFVGQAGLARWTGLVVACFAFGSAVAGVVYGARTWRAGQVARFGLQAVVFGVLPLVLLAAVDVPVLAGLLFVVGLATAPLLIAAFGVIEVVTPPARLTESMALLTTGINVGYGLAAPAVGAVADAHGGRVALTVPIGTALLVLVLGSMTTVVLRRRALPSVAGAAPAADVVAACHDGNRAALP